MLAERDDDNVCRTNVQRLKNESQDAGTVAVMPSSSSEARIKPYKSRLRDHNMPPIAYIRRSARPPDHSWPNRLGP